MLGCYDCFDFGMVVCWVWLFVVFFVLFTVVFSCGLVFVTVFLFGGLKLASFLFV